jgi:thioredoxin
MSDTVQPTSLATFAEDVIEASRDMPVLVDFWASWCGPCKSLAPILKDVALSLAGQARVVKVDTDAEEDLARQFQIRSIPTVMLFRDGKVVSQFTGLQPEQAIKDWVKPFLAAVAPPEPAADSPEILAARLFFADELAAVGTGSADLDALYREGLRAAVQGAHERAIESFLTLTTRSRAYRDDAGRLALLRLFEALGTADPLVQDARRKLAGLLH